MIKKCISSGFDEVAHTADWALKVWSGDLDCLFVEAAHGMYTLMEIRLESGPRVTQSFELECLDLESLLVSFLSELLYKIEEKRQAFDVCSVTIEGFHMKAQLEGAPISYQKKEIKAVTFHNLNIIHREGKYEVTIVFDV